MPDWIVPALLAAGGGTGLGTLITAIITARGSAYQQLLSLVEQLQAARKDDREIQQAYAAKVDVVLAAHAAERERLAIEQEHSADLYVWAVNGAPPPPPVRREPTLR